MPELSVQFAPSENFSEKLNRIDVELSASLNQILHLASWIGISKSTLKIAKRVQKKQQTLK